MKNARIGLFLFIVAISLFYGATTVNKNHDQQAIIVNFPSLSEMTPAEKEVQLRLYDGDNIARIRLLTNNEVTYAVYNRYTYPIKKIGDTATVNSFMNAGEYLVEN